MIISFYDKNFKGLNNNASLVMDVNSFKLIKKPIELNQFRCVCEAFEEKIQPTFVIAKTDRGRYVYGALAGIPILNKKNQTEITATDIKSILSSDIVMKYKTRYSNVESIIEDIIQHWNDQANQNSIKYSIKYEQGFISTPLGDYIPPSEETKVYNALTEIQALLRYYKLYIDTEIDLKYKKVDFIIGNMMKKNMNVKLWEYGIKNYGKYIANVNQVDSYVKGADGSLTLNNKWILTANNDITQEEAKRDMFPIRRKVIVADNRQDSDKKALEQLLNSLYNEDININIDNVDFGTNFAIYTDKGEPKYKDLPCGELEYDASGLKRVKIGFRYSDINLI